MPDGALRAQHIQPADDTTRRIAQRSEKSLSDEIRTALRKLAEATSPLLLLTSLRTWNIYKVIEVLPLAELESDLTSAFDTIAGAHDAAAQAALDEYQAGQTFDRLNEATIEALRSERQGLIAGLTDVESQSVRAVLQRGVAKGATLDQMAEDIAETIGLSERQALAVMNYRAALESGSASALNLKLRDARFDGTVRAAMRGRAIPPDKIDAMVKAYADRSRVHRAKTIAQKQLHDAATAGKRAGWQQMADRGIVTEDQVRRYWLTAGDELVCPFCSTVGLLNDDGIPLDGQYVTINGKINGPEDSHLHCRCSERISAAPLNEYPSTFGKMNPNHDERGRFASGPGDGISQELKDFLAGERHDTQIIAKLPSDLQSFLRSKSNRVLLSADTRNDHADRHKWTVGDLKHIQEMLDHGEAHADRDRELVVLHDKDGWRMIALKVTKDRNEVYLKTYHPTNASDIRDIRSLGAKIRDAV